MPQNDASDKGLHCLLIDCPIMIGITMKNTTQQPLNGNGQVQLITVENSTLLKWVKVVSCDMAV